MKKLIALIFGLILPLFAHASTLSTAASALGAGEWAALTTTNVSTVLGPYHQGGCPGSSNTILAEGAKLVWEPGTQKIFFIGSDHNDYVQFVEYAASTNAWTTNARPAWFDSTCSPRHGEDQSAVDAADGLYFHRLWSTNVLEIYNAAAGTWSASATFTGNVYLDTMLGMDYFADRGEVVLMDPGGGNPTYSMMRRYNVAGNTWTNVLSSTFPGDATCTEGLGSGCLRNFVRCNAVQHACVFTIQGFEDRRMWKMDASAVITALRAAPVSVSIMCPCGTTNPTAVFHPDPVGGSYVVLTQTSSATPVVTFWRYHLDVDSWTKEVDTIPAALKTDFDSNPLFGVAATTISELGVIFFASCNKNGTCRAHIYKPTSNSPPSRPTSLHLQ